jgi:CheY-like chemotaxis protein
MQPEHSLRVLVVDDNRDAADSLCVLLRVWGYDCRTAYDGAAGLEAARAYLPDCLVLDIAMPRLDGYSLARQVRQEPGLESAKLVALSAYSDERHTRRAREAGFDFCLVKPPDLSELERILKMLDETVRLASQAEQLSRENVALAGEARDLLAEMKEGIREIKDNVRELQQPPDQGQPPTRKE